ncbi:hypothetical protein BT67DRAFT_452495 [Trichocladium antarcticum]|uniref:Zn(2)-C6 fungal-type domain-containing protein n=1 Tax=Trichocladium antarcticum TaxID=1450529 RepID=A0AAN6UEQ4_9PEZI|nr:hypothetical protein BT67DRAFT_452495 [Trichocladium antarcticum]
MPRQHLTANACLACRKKRTKCDGQIPCRRCRTRAEECAYEDKKWRTKDHLRSEIERLRTEQRQGNALIRALINNDPEQWDMVLSRMRAGDPPDTIAEWILIHTQGFNTEGPFGVARGSIVSRSTSSFDGLPRGGFSVDGHPARRAASQSSLALPPPTMSPLDTAGLFALPPSQPRRLHLPPPEIPGEPILHTWTNVTSDTRLVQRLFANFFASSLPCLSLVSQPHFLRDFREGTPRYCSEALVNAVLGFACRVTTMTSQLISRISFGDAFIGEAKGLLAEAQDHADLPSIQALGILSLAEMSQGNESEASDLARESVRACIRFLLRTQPSDHDHDNDFRTVRALAYCGGFSLIRLLRLLTGDLEPKTGPLFMRLYPDTGDVGDDGPEARVERGISLQMQFFEELQYCPPLSRFIFEVTEAAHTFSSYHYSRAMTASDLDGAFKKCIDYHRQVAESPAFATDGGPDVLLARIWYQFCLLSLLQPFVTGSASLVDGLPHSLSGEATPGAVCRQASEAIITLTSIYQTRHCLMYLPPLLPYMVFAAALHQLSLANGPACPAEEEQQQEERVESPYALSPRSRHDSADSQRETRPSPSQTQKIAAERPSLLATASTCPPHDSQARWPRVCSFLSSATSDRDELCSPDTASDMLPIFTSRPTDLVTIGSLQLASMGLQHPGAAEAANLLRARAYPGSSLDLV